MRSRVTGQGSGVTVCCEFTATVRGSTLPPISESMTVAAATAATNQSTRQVVGYSADHATDRPPITSHGPLDSLAQ